MKILEIITVPFFQPRGTAFSALQRTKAMAALGHQIDIVTYSIGEDIEIKNTKIHRCIKMPFISEIKMGPSCKKLVLEILLFLKTLQLLVRNKYDLVHAHEEAAYWYALIKPIFKVPMVYDMHSSLPEQLNNFNFGQNNLVYKIFQWSEKKALKNSDRIITICPHLQEMVEKITPQKGSILIENLSVTSFKKISSEKVAEIRTNLGINKEDKVVLYTGTFGFNQGIDLLLKGVKIVGEKVPNVKYVLVGGEKEEIDKIEKLIIELKIDGFVIITGKKPSEEMNDFMQIADLLVSPRMRGTNTPLKIYSYIESGKPIVATNLYTHTQVLDDQIAVLTEPDPQAFAQGILKVLENKKWAENLAFKAKQLFHKKYGYENYVNRVKELLESLELDSAKSK